MVRENWGDAALDAALKRADAVSRDEAVKLGIELLRASRG
jgi:hypothetical protein